MYSAIVSLRGEARMAGSGTDAVERIAGRTSGRRRGASAAKGLAAVKLDHALRSLDARGEITGERSRKLSVRVDPGVLEAAKRETGIENTSDLVNAALAIAATARRDFGTWLLTQAGRLPDDFELPMGRMPEDDDDLDGDEEP
jgi:hypothetical protein